MAAIVINGQATSFTLPNYVGELFELRKRQNAFMRLIGGLNGNVRLVGHTEFSLGVDYELPAPKQAGATEGAAPTKSVIGTSQASNILQIFQEGVEMTYTAQSAHQAISGLAVVPGSGQGPIQRPGTLAWQIARKIDIVQNDFNYSFLRGTYQKPVDNTTARRTRGVCNAVVTNLFPQADTPWTKARFEAMLRDAVENGAFNRGDEVYALGDGTQLDALATLYSTETSKPASRTVAGVAIQTIVTSWATVNLVWEPDMAPGTLLITHPKYLHLVAMPIVVDGNVKGIFFAEKLAKTGSSDTYQLYGEWGVDYTHEVFHTLATGLPV